MNIKVNEQGLTAPTAAKIMNNPIDDLVAIKLIKLQVNRSHAKVSDHRPRPERSLQNRDLQHGRYSPISRYSRKYSSAVESHENRPLA